ncbi:MAG: M23 family metallopeptidase, partial [Rhodospirillaceae bacterium]
LSKLAQRHQVDTVELARINQISPPYSIRTGQVLVLPSESSGVTGYGAPQPGRKPDSLDYNPVHGAASASVENVAQPPYSTKPPPATAALLPLAHDAKPLVTIEANRRGQVPLARTKSKSSLPAAVAAPAVAATAVTTASVPVTAMPTPDPNETKASVATPLARSGGRLIWPVRGKVLSDFGLKPDGRHNDGVNIAAARGAPVIAADSGIVAYVGNELRGYGNLLLVRHPNGLMTAYAHLDRTLVERGAKVRRGQKIGTVGATGTVTSPQLHFEVRKGSQAVDPGDFLEQSHEATERSEPIGDEIKG